MPLTVDRGSRIGFFLPRLFVYLGELAFFAAAVTAYSDCPLLQFARAPVWRRYLKPVSVRAHLRLDAWMGWASHLPPSVGQVLSTSTAPRLVRAQYDLFSTRGNLPNPSTRFSVLGYERLICICHTKTTRQLGALRCHCRYLLTLSHPFRSQV